MKKSIIICIGLLAAGMSGFAQMPKWCMPPYLVDMSGTPSLTSSSLQTATFARSANAAYDQSGNMLFYVVNGNVYLASGTSTTIRVGHPGYTDAVGLETGIVGVPGYCNRFYIIVIDDRAAAAVNLRYSMVEVSTSGAVAVVSGFNNIDLGTVGHEYAGMAISKLRADKTRFLFTIGRASPGIKRFLITNAGISAQASVYNYSSIPGIHRPYEAELYEDTSTGTMKLAWGDSYASGGGGAQAVTVMNLDNTGSYVSYQQVSISGLTGIRGLEFFDNGTKIMVSQENSTSTNTGIAIVNLALSSTTFISGSQACLSHIEKAKNGNYYVINTSKELVQIDPSAMTVTSVLSLPSMPATWHGKSLPDQVDDENYNTATYRADLMSRDAVNDLGIEPNPSDDVWSSPDIWNRRNNIGSPTVNQDPGYGGGGNLMKVRIRNRGCVTSQPSYVKLYWTLGATLERWPASWNGSTLINGVAAGNEIKNYDSTYDTYVVLGGVDKGYVIPALLPGQDIVITAKWYPPDPATYNDPRVSPTAMICFLARIDDPVLDPMYSEQSSTTSSVGRNVKYNNNIVTRNSFLINLGGSYMVAPSGGTILLGNYFEETTFFDIRFHGLNDQDADFAGLGNVTLRMDEHLWNAWIGGGAMAEGVSISNYESREVMVNDLNNVVLRNVRMQPGELMGIGSFFQLSAPTDVVHTYQFAFSQMKSEAAVGEEEYGSQCVFSVSVNGQDESGDDGSGTVPGTPFGKPGQVNEQHAEGNELAIYPNPANDKVTIRFAGMKQGNPVQVNIADMSGRMVQQSVEKVNCNGSTCAVIVNTKALKGGMYIISLNVNGVDKSVKVEVTH